MQSGSVNQWEFIDGDGTFRLANPERTSYLYFPLVNDAGMMSCITPDLRGDAKTGHGTFLLPPVTAEDLHSTACGRNFWLRFEDGTVWSVAGNSARQRAERSTDGLADEVTLEAGFLWQKTVRRNKHLGVQAETTNFVPAVGGHVELMRVSITNTGDEARTITPTAAIPIFGRSADRVRDHRHVTSLLHRISTTTCGVVVQPTLSFDERGHRNNEVSYGVGGSDPDGSSPVGFFPVLEDFIGEGGSLDWPEAVVSNREPDATEGEHREGFEALGGLRFAKATLRPGETVTYRLALSISEGADHSSNWAYLPEDRFAQVLDQTRVTWRARLDRLSVKTGDPDFDRWLRWVAVQPWLRQVYGCSFLPHHDYGRGGRGWRDLWQDCLALILMDAGDRRQVLWKNFAGVRIDGSNATIVGREPGEFVADRNLIPRVWMDHGAWSWLTTRLYIDQTGDLEFLLEPQAYFRDMHLKRCREVDSAWNPDNDVVLKTATGQVYTGTVVEHLVIQNAAAFFNVGRHNNLLLDSADWNDGLDMARRNGESVAFSSLYASNLLEIADFLEHLALRSGVGNLHLAEECLILLDTLDGGIDYSSVRTKQALLQRYLDACNGCVSGGTAAVPLGSVVSDLRGKGCWLLEHVRSNEWIKDSAGYAWFNGYYDDDGERLEGDHENGVRITLTGQVFALMSGAATDEQAREVVRSVNHYLWDERVGGCRLNTDFGEVLLNLGRFSGFAFGHKENGAMFCHMAVMYANALYSRGLADAGHRVLQTIYRHCVDFEKARILPGIPEYFNARGRGMYHYLTGSASWYVLTMLTQVFGLRGCLGDLVLKPQIPAEQFDPQGELSVEMVFADRRLRVVYRNPSKKEAGLYRIGRVRVADEDLVPFEEGSGVTIPRRSIENLDSRTTHELVVDLI